MKATDALAESRFSSRIPWRLRERIGHTPLLDLSVLVGRPEVRILAKAEMTNPGGSVKDRPALAMVEAAETEGRLGPGGGILEASSGNTGIALAMIGAAAGYRVTVCLPENASRERRRLLRAYGAEVRLTDPLAGSDGAIEEARRLASAASPEVAYLDQYSNDANWQSHFRTTGPEIWEQSGGAVTHFVAGLGTSGTFTGVGRFLRAWSPEVELVSMQPDGPLHGLEGLKHMPTALVPQIYDPGLADRALTVTTEDAYRMARRLARELGLLVGVSSAANLVAALELVEGLDQGTVVTVLCDGGERYLSERFWEAA